MVESALEDGATEMTMIAAENVFERQVSKILNNEARVLLRMVRGLKDLRIAVARARFPKSRKYNDAGEPPCSVFFERLPDRI